MTIVIKKSEQHSAHPDPLITINATTAVDVPDDWHKGAGYKGPFVVRDRCRGAIVDPHGFAVSVPCGVVDASCTATTAAAKSRAVLELVRGGGLRCIIASLTRLRLRSMGSGGFRGLRVQLISDQNVTRSCVIK